MNNKCKSNRGEIVLDDGEFFVELNIIGNRGEESGWLVRRGMLDSEFPGGLACIGSFGPRGDKWLSVAMEYLRKDNLLTGKVELSTIGTFSSRNLAIHSLWSLKNRLISMRAEGIDSKDGKSLGHE